MASSKSKRQFVVDSDGRAVAVILPIEEYEDLWDLAEMGRRRNEPTVSWEEVQRRLRAEGILPE